jgi:glycosyltransferase involved in cell wall biosynthesis
MSFLDHVAVLVLTLDEAPNIGRALEALRDFPEVVVLDSGSRDDTLRIVAAFPNARIAQRSFDTHANQWNFGLFRCGIERPFVLALDADHIVPRALVDEIARLSPSSATCGFRARFRYCVFGEALSGALYPPSIVLFRRERGHFIQSGHTQRLVIDGAVVELAGVIDHDDRKPLARWFGSQQKYAALEARHLLGTPRDRLRLSDRVRRLGWLSPWLVGAYTLVVKRCALDGWRGWFYVLQRVLAETLIALEIIDRRRRAEAAVVAQDRRGVGVTPAKKSR